MSQKSNKSIQQGRNRLPARQILSPSVPTHAQIKKDSLFASNSTRSALPVQSSIKSSSHLETATGGSHYRSILEVLKLCSPYEVILDLSLLNKRWAEAASSFELWLTYGEDLHIPYNRSEHPKLTFARLNLSLKKTVTSLTWDRVAFLDLETSTWETKALSTPILDVKMRAYALFYDGSIFGCGGFCRTRPYTAVSDAYIIKRDGEVVPQSPMHMSRYAHGVVALQRKVFVFGGLDDDFSTSLFTNELFDGQWTPLPDLATERWDFSPCVQSDVIYLCGGHNSTVETFNPITLKFSQIPHFSLQESSVSLGVVHEDCLVIVTEGYITRWDVKKKMKTTAVSEYKKDLFRDSVTIRGTVVEDLIYLVLEFGKCDVIDVRTGKLLKSIELADRQ